jgi:hypothetical protein
MFAIYNPFRTPQYVVSASSGDYSRTGSTGLTYATNLEVTVTSHGGVIHLGLFSDGSGNRGYVSLDEEGEITTFGRLNLHRNGVAIDEQDFGVITTGSGSTLSIGAYPLGGFRWFDSGTIAGSSYTYKVEVAVQNANYTLRIKYAKLFAHEIF